MLYFTPELYLAYQNQNDAIADAAGDQWDAAIEAYRFSFDNVKHLLSNDFRAFFDTICLHDAEVVGELKVNGFYALGVLPEDVSEPIALFYRLVKPVEVREDVFPKHLQSNRPYWLYEEAGVEGDHLSQNILLSNGKEVIIHFSDFTTANGPVEALNDSIRDFLAKR